MNELIFFLHILIVLVLLSLFLRMGGKSALSAFVALCGVLANLFVVKEIQLFGFHATASDVFAVGGILGLNLIQELYGSKEAKNVVHGSLLALIFFACMSQIHLLYQPSLTDHTQGAFLSLLSSTPRIVCSSIGVYYFVQRVDLYFFRSLRKRIDPFGLRVFFSLALSQALDTILFSFFGLYGVVSSLSEIIVVSYLIKCAVIICSTPIASLLKRFSLKESFS